MKYLNSMDIEKEKELLVDVRDFLSVWWGWEPSLLSVALWFWAGDVQCVW